MTYFIAAVPFSYIVLRIFFNGDIRDYGSGNAGATNFYRVTKKVFNSKFSLPGTIIVALLDMAKGFFPVFFLPNILSGELITVNEIAVYQIICGIVAIIAHVFPIYLRFRGGKGVLTAGGVVLALTPAASVFVVILVFVMIAVIRIVSISSLIGAVLYPLSVYYFYYEDSVYYFYFSLFCAFFIILTHRENIKRIIQGTEKKLF